MTVDQRPLNKGIVSTLFIENIDQIDSAYWNGKQVVGMTWQTDVYLTGPTDDNGFVCDFSIFKNIAKSVLKKQFDHVLIVPNSRELKTNHNKHPNVFVAPNWEYHCPEGGIRVLNSEHFTTQSLEAAIAEELSRALPMAHHKLVVKLKPQRSQEGTFFQYTHGISGHAGNCQRLFHGHRSLIKVFEDGINRPEYEKLLRDQFFKKYVHIVSQNQIKESTSTKTTIEYEGCQGWFRGAIPNKQMLLLEDSNTSIETITKNAAQFLKRQYLGDMNIEVRCFEGIGKGSISEIKA